MKFWAKAMYTTMHLLNQSPTQAVKKMTLEEAWFGRETKNQPSQGVWFDNICLDSRCKED